MNRWKDTLLSTDNNILTAIEVIDSSAMQIALVVDKENRLLGTVTDGDIRRGLLRGLSLDKNVSSVMNTTPIYASVSASREELLYLMKKKSVNCIPILDDDKRIIKIKFLREIVDTKQHENPVVLMAGGLGTRLRPLTNECPKSLLKIGSKPILQIILENFVEQGFYQFYISVNYRSEMIKEYFGDGSRWGVSISYINEEKRMGTCGALRLVSIETKKPMIVMNGDILTKINFEHLLDFHRQHKATATMCIREYNYQIPYGVVELKQHRLLGINEKPIKRFFVNAGIYVLDSHILSFIPEGEFFDMTDLLAKAVEENEETIAFPIREYWIDIGRMTDFERANIEFEEVFK